jgi:hypothetical protein
MLCPFFHAVWLRQLSTPVRKGRWNVFTLVSTRFAHMGLDYQDFVQVWNWTQLQTCNARLTLALANL